MTPPLQLAQQYSIVFYSSMYQAVVQLVPVQRVTGGTFITTRSSTHKAVAKLYPDLPMRQFRNKLKLLSPAWYQFRSADIVVTGSIYKDVLAQHPARKVLTFHGTYWAMGRAKIAECQHFNLLCVNGPRVKQMLARHQDEFPLNCVDTGYLPFSDFPMKNDTTRQLLLANMGLDPGKKTIVYTPSRKGYGSWERMADTLVAHLGSDFNLVLRPHPSQSIRSRHEDRKGFRRIESLAEGLPTVRVDIGQYLLADLLSVADLMISDANSPAEESLFYDVPQLFIESPTSSRDTMRAMLDEGGIHPDDRDRVLTLYGSGPILDSARPEQLRELVERAFSDANLHASAREQYFQWVFGKRDREAPQRVAAAMAQLLR